MVQSTEEILEERGRTHGEFVEHARCTQAIMRALERERNWAELPDIMKEALHMQAHKMARVVTGNPYVADHWDDTAGYARLVSQRILPDASGLRPEYDLGRAFAGTIRRKQPEPWVIEVDSESAGPGTPEDGGQHVRMTNGDATDPMVPRRDPGAGVPLPGAGVPLQERIGPVQTKAERWEG